jgi:hypothetical protein
VTAFVGSSGSVPEPVNDTISPTCGRRGVQSSAACGGWLVAPPTSTVRVRVAVSPPAKVAVTFSCRLPAVA